MYYESRAKKFILGFLFFLSLLPYAVMLYMGINGATNGGGFNLGESTEPMPKGIDGFITDIELSLILVGPFLPFSIIYDIYYLFLRKK